MGLLGFVLPGWAKWAAIALAALALYGVGRLDGTRIEATKRHELIARQAVASAKLLQARVEILREIEVKYLPARAKIITQTETIIKEVPIHVSKAADSACTVPAGFVRVHDTAFGFDDPAVAGEPDDGPAGIPLSQVAETIAHNAGACRQWREQALSLRLAYEAVRTAAPAK